MDLLNDQGFFFINKSQTADDLVEQERNRIMDSGTYGEWSWDDLENSRELKSTGKPCPECEGSGTYKEYIHGIPSKCGKCPDCHGTGMI